VVPERYPELPPERFVFRQEFGDLV
jgi:hypothetical protein